MTTWHYLPHRRWTPLTPIRRFLAAQRRPAPLAEGEEIVGWEARVSGNAGEHLPSPGTVGTVVAAELRDGVLHHRIEFPGGVVVTVPVSWPDQAWPGIDLLAPTGPTCCSGSAVCDMP